MYWKPVRVYNGLWYISQARFILHGSSTFSLPPFLDWIFLQNILSADAVATRVEVQAHVEESLLLIDSIVRLDDEDETTTKVTTTTTAFNEKWTKNWTDLWQDDRRTTSLTPENDTVILIKSYFHFEVGLKLALGLVTSFCSCLTAW